MIVANLATYPARRIHLRSVIESIAAQCDRINVVLNEYSAEIAELRAFDNVQQIIPTEDTKDAGKFYPDISDAEYVFLIDDDIIYPADYVATSLRLFDEIGPDRKAAGYHGSYYVRPRFSLRPKAFLKWLRYKPQRITDYRQTEGYRFETSTARYMDQMGSGVLVVRAENMPSYAYMRDSQKFVDVRLATWFFSKNIPLISLPKAKGWFKKIRFEETIYGTFTKAHMPHVSKEIMGYAFQRPEAGKPVTNDQE